MDAAIVSRTTAAGLAPASTIHKVLLQVQDAAAALPEDPEAPKVVLVIEDDDDFRTVLSLRLREAGFEVVGVHDAGAAWHAARRHPFQAAVVDYRLPGIDGRTLARQLKRERSVNPTLQAGG